MNVLVTGADGFVGGWMVDALATRGDRVVGTFRGARPPNRAGLRPPTSWIPLDLAERASVEAMVREHPRPDAVVHLAAVASVGQAAEDLVGAWDINLSGTVRLLETLLQVGLHGVPLLVVSTAEVYGPGRGAPRCETDPVDPVSAYAATKAAVELVSREAGWRAAGALRVVIARPFPHTGPGQGSQYVVPAFVGRLRAAAREGRVEVATGNLDPVRELLDVRDVVAAYLVLLQRGGADTVYNVARGVGHSLGDIFSDLARRLHPTGRPVPDPALVRPADIPHLVGDGSRLSALGWTPQFPLSQTLQDVIDAQAD